MAGIGDLLGLLSGAGQGTAQNRAAAPVNAMNNMTVQQAQQDKADQLVAAQALQQIFSGGGQPASPAPQQAPNIMPQTAASPIVGNSILTPQPGQQSQPMQQPRAVPVAVPVQPQQGPQDAPVNQQAAQAQSPVSNPLLANPMQLYAQILRMNISPGAKKQAIEMMSQIQGVYAKQQDQLAQQKERDAMTQYYGARTADDPIRARTEADKGAAMTDFYKSKAAAEPLRTKAYVYKSERTSTKVDTKGIAAQISTLKSQRQEILDANGGNSADPKVVDIDKKISAMNQKKADMLGGGSSTTAPQETHPVPPGGEKFPDGSEFPASDGSIWIKQGNVLVPKGS